MRTTIMIDSGAYSVWTKGQTIDIKDYIAFLKECEDAISHYINLDVLPGQHRATRSRDDVEKAAKASYRNLQIMKDAGLEPIPVFHRGEPFKWLEKFCQEEKYICLSPLTDTPADIKRKWLKDCFKIIPSKIRVHGLGVTDLRLMKGFPFHSVDSMSWASGPSYGMVPFRFPISPRPVVIYFGSHNRPNSFDRLGDLQRQVISNKLEELGVSVEEMRYSAQARMLVSLRFWLGIERPPIIYFVHNPNDIERANTLKKAGAKFQLLSYYYVTECAWLKESSNNKRTRTPGGQSYAKSLNMLANTGSLGVTKGPALQNWSMKGYVYSRQLRLHKRLKLREANAD